MSLREEAVEAMAEASSVDRNLSAKVNAELWGRMSAQMREKTLERTERALDALLDFLGAHTEEWADGDGKPFCEKDGQFHEWCDCPTDDYASFLIAVLRGTTEEPEP